MYTLNPFLRKFVTLFLVVGVVLSSFGTIDLRAVHAQTGTDCDDGIDNDSDGQIDYPQDTDCFDYYGGETAAPPVVVTAVPSTRSNSLNHPTYTYRVPGEYSLTIPAGVYKVDAQAWGAGGGGGSGLKTKNHHVSGFGGGGGGLADGSVAVVPGDVVTIVVGAGGSQGEGGSNSEASIKGSAIAGAGGGGGGLSVGGPGYKNGNSFISTLATIVVAAVLTYISAGALTGLASTITGTFGSGAVATVTAIESVGVVGVVNGVSMMSAYTLTAVGGTAVTGTVTSSALFGGLATSLASGDIIAKVVDKAAQEISKRDPRVAGGIDGLSGLGFGGVRGGLGGGIGGKWYQTTPTNGSSGTGSGGKIDTRTVEAFNTLSEPSIFSKVLGFVTFAKDVFATSFQPVAGTGGDKYAGYASIAGASGGPYSEVGGNPYASSGGQSGGGASGGERGRFGRDGSGHGNDPRDTRAQDGGFPGGGGGGSDTGVGGYGGDGQVVLTLSDDNIAITPGNPVPECRDGFDNADPEDTLVDSLDPGCSSLNDDDETDAPGVDNPTVKTTPSVPVLTCPTTLKTSEVGTFTAKSTDLNPSEKLTFNFAFEGGGTSVMPDIASGAVVTATKAWSDAGTKTVTVTVTNKALAVATNTCDVSVEAGPLQPQVFISANPPTVNPGENTTLSWSTLRATTCTASALQPDAWNGTKAINGTESTGNLTIGKTYTLTCDGTGGTKTSDSVTVGVNTLLNGITYTSVPANVLAGAQMTVVVNNSGTKTWGANHDLVISPENSQTTELAVQGLDTTSPSQPKMLVFTAPTTPGTYVLHSIERGVEWFGGVQRFTVTTPVIPAPLVILNTNVTTLVSPGGPVTLTWAPQNATACTASATPANPGWSGSIPVTNGNRSKTVSISQTTAFGVSCSNGVADVPPATDSVTVAVGSAPYNDIDWNTINTPASVVVGSNISVTTNVTNTGTKTWGTDYRFAIKNSARSALQQVGLTAQVAPNGTAAPSFSVTAPTTPGSYTYYFQAYDPGSTWFGVEVAKVITVTSVPVVLVNGITYNIKPSSVAPGASFNMTVTNSGTKPWGVDHYLAIRTSGGTHVSNVSVNAVLPGVSRTVTMTAPATVGTYSIEAFEHLVGYFGGPQVLAVTNVPSISLSPTTWVGTNSSTWPTLSASTVTPNQSIRAKVISGPASIGDHLYARADGVLSRKITSSPTVPGLYRLEIYVWDYTTGNYAIGPSLVDVNITDSPITVIPIVTTTNGGNGGGTVWTCTPQVPVSTTTPPLPPICVLTCNDPWVKNGNGSACMCNPSTVEVNNSCVIPNFTLIATPATVKLKSVSGYSGAIEQPIVISVSPVYGFNGDVTITPDASLNDYGVEYSINSNTSYSSSFTPRVIRLNGPVNLTIRMRFKKLPPRDQEIILTFQGTGYDSRIQPRQDLVNSVQVKLNSQPLYPGYKEI